MITDVIVSTRRRHQSAVQDRRAGSSCRAGCGLGAEQPAIPKHGLVQGRGDVTEFRVGRIDQHVVLDPRDDAWHHQDEAPLFETPGLAKTLADRCWRLVPAGE